MLVRLGFDPGTPDGYMGGKTRAALKAFQLSLGLPTTGHLTDETVRRLKSKIKEKNL